MTASFPNRNIVVASVQTGCEITPSHQVGAELPEQRENGGDLQTGDTFYHSDYEVVFFYDGNSWVPMGGPGLLRPIYDRISNLEDRVDNLEKTVEGLIESPIYPPPPPPPIQEYYDLEADQAGMGFHDGESYVVYMDDEEDTSDGWYIANVKTTTGGNNAPVLSAKLPKSKVNDGTISEGDVITIRTRHNAPMSEWARFKPFTK